MQQVEKLSALVDGEGIDNQVLETTAYDDELQSKWQSYHLIRDVMHNDTGEVIHLDIAGRVALALEQEVAYLPSSTVLESQPTPDSWQKMPFWQKLRPWAAQFTQIGVAACVSLAVIVGVQSYNQTGDSPTGDSPLFDTLPIGGHASPVSYGVPTEVNGGQLQQLQEQRKRVDSMLRDYELQRRLYEEQMENHQQTQNADAIPDGSAFPPLGMIQP